MARREGLIAPSRHDRPVPDEAPLEAHDGTCPRLRDLSFGEWKAIVVRAGKGFMDDNCMMLASALAYSSFFTIPSVIIVAVGLFTLIASPATITSVIGHLHGVVPGQATQLLDQSLRRADSHPGGSIVMTIIGFVLAVWSVTGAMNAYMTALNVTYERKDRRSFVRKRIVALKMAVCIGFAFVLVAVLTILGPVVEHAIASRIGVAGGVLNWAWWVAQWPLLLGGLLIAFAALLYLGPDVDQPRWEWMTPGSLVAALLWIVASAGFAVYTATFSSYNKTWGSLAAVIVMLTWLWLTAMALLLGAEVNREARRARSLHARA